MKKVFNFLWKNFEKIFIWSSGARYEILETVPTEKAKYFGIGGTIIFTSLMACFSGGYAIFTAFKNFYVAIFFGLFWGALIFNLDRFIVNSMYSDGKHSISKMEILTGLPRLIIAIFLGIVISTPLEIKVFEKEVDFEINNIKAAKRKEFLDSSKVDQEISTKKTEKSHLESDLNNVRAGKTVAVIVSNRLNDLTSNKQSYQTQINNANNTIKVLRDKIQQIKDKAQNQSRELNQFEKYEIYDANKNINRLNNDATELNSKINSINSETSQLQSNELSNTTNALNSLNNQLNQINIEITNLQNKKAESDSLISREVQKYNGFMAKLEAFSILREKHSSLNLAAYFIMFLIIIIEISPVFFKMMVEKGPYDDIVNRIKHEINVRQLEIQSNINQEINTAVKINLEKHEIKLNAELHSNKEIVDAISKAQQEIAIVAIEKWKEEQKEIMRKSGSAIIESNTNNS